MIYPAGVISALQVIYASHMGERIVCRACKRVCRKKLCPKAEQNVWALQAHRGDGGHGEQNARGLDRAEFLTEKQHGIERGEDQHAAVFHGVQHGGIHQRQDEHQQVDGEACAENAHGKRQDAFAVQAEGGKCIFLFLQQQLYKCQHAGEEEREHDHFLLLVVAVHGLHLDEGTV